MSRVAYLAKNVRKLKDSIRRDLFSKFSEPWQREFSNSLPHPKLAFCNTSGVSNP